MQVVRAKTVSSVKAYSGSYYNSLGGLNTLISGKYSGKQVFEGLRALIGYASSGEFSSSSSDKYVSAFGNTIKGTDKKHPKYGGTSAGTLANLWQTSDRLENDTEPAGCCRLFYSNVYTINSARSNKPYADLSNNEITTTYYTTGTDASSFNKVSKYVNAQDIKSNYKGDLTGYATSSKFEPTDQYKGDIARIFA